MGGLREGEGEGGREGGRIEGGREGGREPTNEWTSCEVYVSLDLLADVPRV